MKLSVNDLMAVIQRCDETLGQKPIEYINELTQLYLALKDERNHCNKQAHFTLYDEVAEDETRVCIENKSNLGLALIIEGYGDCSTKDHCGPPIFIEKHEDEVTLHVYADINNEEPTHSISLEGARLSNFKADTQ